MMQILAVNKEKLREKWSSNNADVEQESWLWKFYLPGIDPVDINRGGDYLFLWSNAASLMYDQKRPKTRYVFEGEQPEGDCDKADNHRME